MNGLLLSMSIGKFHYDEFTEEKLHYLKKLKKIRGQALSNQLFIE